MGQPQDEDLETLRQQLAESQQTAEALRGSGVQARAQAQEYGERARRAETLNQEHSADLASLRWLPCQKRLEGNYMRSCMPLWRQHISNT